MICELDHKTLQQYKETDNENTTIANVENANIKVGKPTQQAWSIFSVVEKYLQLHILTIVILLLAVKICLQLNVNKKLSKTASNRF